MRTRGLVLDEPGVFEQVGSEKHGEWLTQIDFSVSCRLLIHKSPHVKRPFQCIAGAGDFEKEST